MSKKLPVKHEPDCTGIGKWLGWLIVAIVVGACLVKATKASGQGLGVGALISASAPPATVTQPGASPGVVVGDCSGDTTAPIVTSDGLIVSTTGTSFGSGTVASPIRLANALDGTADALSGLPVTRRRLYLRGGTYPGRFFVQLVGTAANPWIVQPYPGEVPILNQTSTVNPVGVITYHVQFISGPSGPAAFVEFRGIEFTDEDYVPNNTLGSGRDDSQDAQSGLNGYHGGIRIENARNITFENCVIHDQSGSGVLTSSTDARNITVRGCLFYNIGVPGRSKHHGLYLFNEFYASPNNSRHVIDGNIFINCVAYGIQLYSTGTGLPVSGIYCTNNIVRDSGGETAAVTLWDGHRDNNGGGTNPGPSGEDIRFVSNVVSQTNSTRFLRIRDIRNSIINGNYFQLGASRMLFQSDLFALIFRTNTVVSTHASAGATENAMDSRADFASWAALNPNFDFNTYKLSDTTGFNVDGSARSFAQWQTQTGDDASSTYSSTTTSGLTIRYIPNRLDTNLVYFVILNEASAATVDIDLTPFWPSACGTYEIRNAGTYTGALASSGAWTGQSAITITMTGQNYTEPAHGLGPTWVQTDTFFAGIARRTRANATAAEPSFP